MNDSNGRQYDSNGKTFFGNSRSNKMAANNLGIAQDSSLSKIKVRSPKLDKVQKYLDGSQYNGLAPWKECCDIGEDSYTEIRKRKPSIIFPFAKIYQNRVASKLVGESTFPKLKIEDDEDASYFLNIVKDASFFEAKMLVTAKDLISFTSAFARFRIIQGVLKIENYNPNYCYPEFDEIGNLESVEIRYIYESDETDKDGSPVLRWYKMELETMSDTIYDNPQYKEGQIPEFVVAETVEHNLGFVQGEWFRWGESTWDVDGTENPMVCDLHGFIDSINYNLSQSDSSASYGLDPQLTLSGIDQDEVDNLIKSSSKAWLLGREGKADFMEVSGSGIDTADKLEQKLTKKAGDAARIVFHDPDKMMGSAQSGRALEVLNAPLVELINELRPYMARGIKSLLEKILVTLVRYNQDGQELAFTMPAGWQPLSLTIDAVWGSVFELTTQDKQQIVSMGIQVSNANIISRDTMGKWLQAQGIDFGVEDWDFERQKVDTQKTFGGFF